MRTELDPVGHRADELRSMGSKTVLRIIGTMAIVLLAGSSAFGQFLVQPMKMQVTVEPGKRFMTDFKLENLSTVVTETITLSLMDITQDANGLWQEILPDDTSVDRSSLRSCLSWLRLEKDSVEVGPFKIEPTKLLIEVPPGTRGYYFATLFAESAPRADVIEGFETLTILQYVVPVIVEVAGRPMRHEVELTDVGLAFQRQTENKPAATVVSLDIQNDGGTYSRLQGVTRVWGQWGGHWRKIAELKLPDTGIIPGVKLHLLQDVGRPLPSATYKVEGYLYVDGRRSGRVEKEIEFKGDPRVVTVKADVALDLEPRDLVIDTFPGASRVAVLRVVNASEEEVTVNAELMLPDHMSNMVNSRGVRGEVYGCADWVTVEPRQFKLRGYGRQNLRIAARMPNSATQLPCYYATVRLRATYPDGTRGGVTNARLCVQNRKLQSPAQIDSLLLTLSESSPSRYLVTARFINNGDTHVQPHCRAVLTIPPGDVIRKRIAMSSEAYDQSGALLPLDTRNFSGVLDLSDVPAGTYRLTSILEHDRGGSVQDQRGLLVIEQGGQKIVRVVGTDQVPRTVINL